MCGVLPVFTVDEDVYDNRPTLLIGTADKFAQVIREKEPTAYLVFGTALRLILSSKMSCTSSRVPWGQSLEPMKRHLT